MKNTLVMSFKMFRKMCISYRHALNGNIKPLLHRNKNVTRTVLRALSTDGKLKAEKEENRIEENNSTGTQDVKHLLEEAVINEENPKNLENMWATSPYPEGAVLRDQSRHFLRPKKDPRETSIVMFPGQGTQFVGMGKDLIKYPIAKDMFDAASDILGYDLYKLCVHGPKSKLDKTVHCQPAVMVCSLAAVEKLKEERPRGIEQCVATAGFSLGEISALVFAGSLLFEEAVKLVKVRAEAMQLACDIHPSGMMVVLINPDSKLNYACLEAKEWCLQKGVESPTCSIASYMYPQCKVVAGNVEALEFLVKNAERFKLRRLKRMPVSGAFHTDLMRPAAEVFKGALRNVDISNPLVPVYSNVDGKRYVNAAHIQRQLPKQIYKPVKWEQTLHILYERPLGDHFPRTFECGPGSSLKSLLKMVNAKAWDTCLSIEA